MTHAHTDKHCVSLDCERLKTDTDRALTQVAGTKWRSALAGLVAAPLRLHRYRNFHAEVIEDALRAYDCRKCS